ncbi:SDR family oxidoreductase [Rhabdobacter roseus]|uniref:NAD(P)-dependent dehydrogenase (Short-subunit alcohol dehydrogenase family) n=1 Tax=Rhabdobacter roseus TaxID=1655419 RepID=A0A840U038_9BACT|nr:glucose 1-dehydrogenase [Rhabdobacter roseus]MBB5286903.1 NAD(P)-dependent dehydrogenase (short-subunit alcohol dehydrogenase family) [Rhabdobacter roseus]
MQTLTDYFNLSGKVALITGASKGIGEATARLLAQAGAQVVISSRKQADLDALANTLRQEGAEVTAVAAHVGDSQQLSNLVEQTMQAYGGVDILVNNAAANPHYGPTVEFPESAFDKIMQVNVRAPLELTRLVQPSMKARGGGSIINISSIAGLTPDPGLGMYSVTKAALNMLTKVFAKELGADGIRVNAVCPGLIKTKFSQALWEDETTLARFTKRLPIARMGTVEEIAGMVLYLASPASGYCTGGIFTADGGTTI